MLRKVGKSWQSMSWVRTFSKLKEEVWLKLLSGEEDVLVEDFCPVDNIVKVFHRDELQMINMFMKTLRFATEIRGPITEEVFENFPSVILHGGHVGHSCKIGVQQGVEWY